MSTKDDSDYEGDVDIPGLNGSVGARPKDFHVTDRYGFTGGNQFTKEGDITIPVAVLRKREMKWLDMLDDWDKWMTKKPKKVKERCRKGIPSSLRSRAWQILCGAKKHMDKNHLRFKELDEMKGDPKWVEIIVKDLDRQFPYHEMFAEKGGAGQQDLFRVLKAYSLHNPRDGYCQAMAPVASVLLMHMPAEEAFWCFVQICDRYLTGYYSPGLEAVQVDGEVLHSLLKKASPATYKHMRKHNIDPILYMTEWYMCIFSRTLPWSSVLRVWDMFLFEGVKVLFRVALVILKSTLGTPESLRRCAGLYESMQVLKNIPMEYLREEFLVEEMLKIHVFERDLESEHSLTVARQRAIRSRQLSKDSAADMLRSIEAMKKKKKKVQPPKSSQLGDNDDTRSIISYVGYGNESPIRERDKRKKEKKKKKERDPGIAIYNQTVKPAWSNPDIATTEEEYERNLRAPQYNRTGGEESDRRNHDGGHSLGVDKQTSKSESALNIAALHKLTREPSIDSSIHEETFDSTLPDSTKETIKNDEDHWLDTSPSKSSSAMVEDSDSSSAAVLEFQDVIEGDMVMYVRVPHENGTQESVTEKKQDIAEASNDFPSPYRLQLPGEIDSYHEEFEAKIEKSILDLSFDGDETNHQVSSAESDLKFQNEADKDFQSSETLKQSDDDKVTLETSETVVEEEEDVACTPTPNKLADENINGPEISVHLPGSIGGSIQLPSNDDSSIHVSEELLLVEETLPQQDDLFDIEKSLEVLPLSETDSSSVSEGKAGGSIQNGLSDQRGSLTEDLEDLDNVSSQVMENAPQIEVVHSPGNEGHIPPNGVLKGDSLVENEIAPIPLLDNIPTNHENVEQVSQKPVTSEEPFSPPTVGNDLNEHSIQASQVPRNTLSDEQDSRKPSPKLKGRSGKKPVPLPKKKGLGKVEAKAKPAHMGNSFITDKL